MLVNEKGSVHDVNILDVTAENYICPKGEEREYHCRIEQKQFNRETGERQSVPRIQKFDKKMFEAFILHNLRRQNYSVDILHDPNVWEKEHGEAERKRIAEEAARREAERKAKEEADIQARVDKAVAEALAKISAKKGRESKVKSN